uniref:Uncharacterized protein n=1 Tax=Gossypium raimondii TaxID=29730 RepID=A0A0D2UF32_GOSRA|nr:hypothetical protein B456_010G187400 [Gossypium raimondii]
MTFIVFRNVFTISILLNVVLSNIFPSGLKPRFHTSRFHATGDEAWKDKEAAVLALGSVGEGCINGLYPHLSEVILLVLY